MLYYFVTSDCFGIPALIKGIIDLNKNVSFSCEIWWWSRIALNSTVTMTFHDELMIFLLLLLFYLTVGLFRKTMPSEFHWWSADPTQSSSHWVERTDCSFLPFFPSRNISDELNSTFRNLKKWETCFHILHLHHVFYCNGYVFFASSLCHVFMNEINWKLQKNYKNYKLRFSFVIFEFIVKRFFYCCTPKWSHLHPNPLRLKHCLHTKVITLNTEAVWISSELTKVGAQLRIYNSHSLH